MFIRSGETVNYLPHLPAFNPKSVATPIRVAFDASRQRVGDSSLNRLLAKDPDRWPNDLSGAITMDRTGRITARKDAGKMLNTVELKHKDTFLLCFLWRGMDGSKEPEMYHVVVNNMGIKPAG